MTRSLSTLLGGLLIAALLTACGTTKVVDTWQSDTVAPEEPDKLAVLVMWPDQLQRLVVERDVVAQLCRHLVGQSGPVGAGCCGGALGGRCVAHGINVRGIRGSV